MTLNDKTRALGGLLLACGTYGVSPVRWFAGNGCACGACSICDVSRETSREPRERREWLALDAQREIVALLGAVS
jgi:hypothetical protein